MEVPPLNLREEAVLTAIRNSIRSRGYPPSVREIGQEVGLLSSSTVHGYLKRLEEKGYLRRDESKPRAMELVGPGSFFSATVEIPVADPAVAGEEFAPGENRGDTLIISREMVGEGEFFTLSMEDQSMAHAGILSGDMLIIRRQPFVADGDIIAAVAGGKTVVRHYHPEVDAKGVQILGKAVALVRKL